MRAAACVENGPDRVDNWPEATGKLRSSTSDNIGKPRAANDLVILLPTRRLGRPRRGVVAERRRRGDKTVIFLPPNSCISDTNERRRPRLTLPPAAEILRDDTAPGVRRTTRPSSECGRDRQASSSASLGPGRRARASLAG